jgi:iron complex transport system substrate-binding protein
MVRAVAGLAMLMLSACGPRPESGADPDIAGPTIVSLNPCADAILAEVAGEGQLLAISHYSHNPATSSMDPASARRWPAIGDTVEEVLAYKPDVVVAGIFIQPSTQRALERLGIRVVTIDVVGSFEESDAQIRDLAALTGHPERGERLVAEIGEGLRRHAAPAGSRPVPAILWQEGNIVAGSGSIVARLLESAGFASLSARRGMGQGDYLTLEEVLVDPPEVLLVAGDGRAQSHPALEHIDGATRAEFRPELYYCAGPSLVRASARLAEIRRSVGA